MGERMTHPIAGHYCGQTQPHAAHTWQTLPTYGSAMFVITHQCAGTTGEMLPATVDHTETAEALAELIWNTSRADEGTISATGAKHVAAALLDAIDAGQVPGLVTSEKVAGAWDEGHDAGPESHALLCECPNPYRAQ